MKILILEDDFPPKAKGGAGIVAHNLAKGYRKKGHEVFVITTTRDKQEEGRTAIDDGLVVHRIYSKYHQRWRAYISIYNPWALRKVRTIFKEVKPEVVHIHNIHYHLSYHCIEIAKNSGAKIFMTLHDVMSFNYGKLYEFINKNSTCFQSFNYKISPWKQMRIHKLRYNPFRNYFIRFYIKKVDKLFSVSGALKKALEDNGINGVITIHNGIDPSIWDTNHKKVEEFKLKHGLQSERIIFFNGGRLGRLKGEEEMLLATSLIAKKFPDVILTIAGANSGHIGYLSNLAKELGIKKIVKFLGWLSGGELVAAYHSSDVVVFPSICLDTFGMVNLEAMACRKPVVGTCFGGTPEILEDGKTGFLVNPLNIEIMAGEISKLISNKKLASQFGEAGFNRLVSNFTLERQVRQYLEYFEGA
jgi:glycosyltransferase involved in cell wall biosynthesis